MLTAAWLRDFRQNLLAWFQEFQRELPWRINQDPYRIWISEIMLQQTRVAAVIPYYERFLSRFPTVASLADAPQDEVLRLWSGLGYYNRARNLQRAAQRIVAQHAGTFPQAAGDVLALPGIGAYTSAAICSIAFGQPLAVLDGNVARVLARIFAVQGELRAPQTWLALQQHAAALLERDAPGDWNQAVMELGATICTPRSPQCLLCPVANFCQAHKLGLQDKIPARRIKRATSTVTLAAAVLLDPRGRTLLLSPPARGAEEITAAHVPTLVSRMWHFPTIAVIKHPARELEKILSALFPDLPARKQKSLCHSPLPLVRHAVTYRQITVHPFHISVAKLPAVTAARLLPLKEVSSLAISNLTRKIARVALAKCSAKVSTNAGSSQKRR